MSRNAISDMLWQKESQKKRSKKGDAKGSVAMFEGVYTIGLCTSRFSSEKVYST